MLLVRCAYLKKERKMKGWRERTLTTPLEIIKLLKHRRLGAPRMASPGMILLVSGWTGRLKA